YFICCLLCIRGRLVAKVCFKDGIDGQHPNWMTIQCKSGSSDIVPSGGGVSTIVLGIDKGNLYVMGRPTSLTFTHNDSETDAVKSLMIAVRRHRLEVYVCNKKHDSQEKKWSVDEDMSPFFQQPLHRCTWNFSLQMSFASIQNIDEKSTSVPMTLYHIAVWTWISLNSRDFVLMKKYFILPKKKKKKLRIH
ncbi:hypothetical protein RFI_08367, partial [Reticulomyxa filosa]